MEFYLETSFSTGNFNDFQLKKDRFAEYLPSDVKNAFGDLFPNEEFLRGIKIVDPVLHSLIQFMHLLCHENVNMRPILKNYKELIEKLEKLDVGYRLPSVTFMDQSNEQSMSLNQSTGELKSKRKYSINGFLSVISNSHDNIDLEKNSFKKSPSMSPGHSPRHSSRSHSPKISPINSPSQSPKRDSSSIKNSPKKETYPKSSLASRRTRSASTAEQIRRDEKKEY